MKDFCIKICGVLKNMQKLVVNEMEWVWIYNSEFTAEYKYKVSITYYKALAKASKEANPPYSNRFNDSI